MLMDESNSVIKSSISVKAKPPSEGSLAIFKSLWEQENFFQEFNRIIYYWTYKKLAQTKVSELFKALDVEVNFDKKRKQNHTEVWAKMIRLINRYNDFFQSEELSFHNLRIDLVTIVFIDYVFYQKKQPQLVSDKFKYSLSQINQAVLEAILKKQNRHSLDYPLKSMECSIFHMHLIEKMYHDYFEDISSEDSQKDFYDKREQHRKNCMRCRNLQRQFKIGLNKYIKEANDYKEDEVEEVLSINYQTYSIKKGLSFLALFVVLIVAVLSGIYFYQQ